MLFAFRSEDCKSAVIVVRDYTSGLTAILDSKLKSILRFILHSLLHLKNPENWLIIPFFGIIMALTPLLLANYLTGLVIVCHRIIKSQKI